MIKNFGMITEKDYLGKSLKDASDKAQQDGFTTRITERDGVSYILTMDYRGDRINFRVSNDTVIAAYGG